MDSRKHRLVDLVLASTVRKVAYFFSHQRDKLQLAALMIVGSAVPLFLCWGLPTLIDLAREARTTRQLIAAEIDQETFRENNAALLALCGSSDTGASAHVFPPAPRLLIVRNGRLDTYQDSLPDRWRPATPADANVLICLGRETATAVDACLDGSKPDLSMFLGYELYIGLPNSLSVAEAHPEVSGRTILRYLTDFEIYDIVSGVLITSGQISGSDPAICTDPPDISPLEVLEGEALRQEVLYYINGDRLTVDGFNDWVESQIGS